MTALQLAVTDGVTIAKRNTIRLRRSPDMIGSIIFMPVLFVLLFGFVFGSVIDIPGMSYREFMVPGIFVQVVLFGASFTGYGLVEDLQKGIIDRFRTLPMASSAVLVGRTVSDLIMAVASLVVMVLVGLATGWRMHTSVPEVLLAFVLLLGFGFAMTWVMATVGLAMRKPEVYNNLVSVVIFPLTFLANTFVDTTRLPAVLRVMADWNPVSAVTQAIRELFGNTDPRLVTPSAWPLQHPILTTVGWTVAILVVFVPLATKVYRKAVSS